jgi:hypothetical protein
MPLRTCLSVVSVSGRTGTLTLRYWILVYLHYISRVALRCVLHSCFIYELIQLHCSPFRLSNPSLSIGVRFLVPLAICYASPLLWLWFLESLLYPHSFESFKRTLTQSTGALFYGYILSLLKIDDEWPLSYLILTPYDVLQSCTVTFQTPYPQPPLVMTKKIFSSIDISKLNPPSSYICSLIAVDAASPFCLPPSSGSSLRDFNS